MTDPASTDATTTESPTDSDGPGEVKNKLHGLLPSETPQGIALEFLRLVHALCVEVEDKPHAANECEALLLASMAFRNAFSIRWFYLSHRHHEAYALSSFIKIVDEFVAVTHPVLSEKNIEEKPFSETKADRIDRISAQVVRPVPTMTAALRSLIEKENFKRSIEEARDDIQKEKQQVEKIKLFVAKLENVSPLLRKAYLLEDEKVRDPNALEHAENKVESTRRYIEKTLVQQEFLSGLLAMCEAEAQR